MNTCTEILKEEFNFLEEIIYSIREEIVGRRLDAFGMEIEDHTKADFFDEEIFRRR